MNWFNIVSQLMRVIRKKKLMGKYYKFPLFLHHHANLFVNYNEIIQSCFELVTQPLGNLDAKYYGYSVFSKNGDQIRLEQLLHKYDRQWNLNIVLNQCQLLVTFFPWKFPTQFIVWLKFKSNLNVTTGTNYVS